MLDSDVAMLYHYKTKEINKTVKRNIERFPENFCFQLTENELEKLEVAICDFNFRRRKVVPIWNHIYKY